MSLSRSRSPVIYVLETAKGYYIGKYSNGGFFEYHLQKAFPWIGKKQESLDQENDVAFEQDWQASIRKEGYQAYYVSRAWYVSADVLGIKILDAFNDTAMGKENPYTQEELMNFLKGVWHVLDKKDYEIMETLMIVLGRSSGYPIVNISNNWLQKGKDADARVLFSTKEMLAREERFAKTMPDLWITLSGDELDKIGDIIETAVQKHTNSKGKIVVNLAKNPQLVEYLSGVVSDSTIKHIEYKLTNYAKGLKGRPPEVLKELQKEIKEIKQGKDKGQLRSEFYKKLIDYYEHRHENWKMEVHKEATKNMQLAEKLLQQWLNVMPNYVGGIFTEVDVRQYDDLYKKSFTKFLQEIIDDTIKYLPEYSATQHEIYQQNRRIYPLIKYLPKTNYEGNKGETVQKLIENKLQNTINNFKYVLDNWHYGTDDSSVYGEQISIWLASQGDTFYHDQMFGQATTWQDIKNY